MTKIIASDLVIGNIFISTEAKELSKSDCVQFCYVLNDLLPKGFLTEQNTNYFEKFGDEYSFLAAKSADKITIKCDKDLLIKFFRMGLPSKIIEAFDIAACKLNEAKSNTIDKSHIVEPKEKTFIKKR